MRFSQKCDRAFVLLSDSKVEQRIKRCEKVAEYGFALLLRFVQVEAALKILRYWDNVKDGWPDRLNFINANWTPLRDLKALDGPKYSSLIGEGGNSLKGMRNRIAHEGWNFSDQEYARHAGVASWALGQLKCRLPSKQDVRKRVATKAAASKSALERAK